MNGNPDHKWNEQLVVPAGQTSAWIEIPGWIKNIVATAHPGGGGSATIQHTTSSREQVLAATALAVDWDPGSVTVKTSRAAMGPVTAVRLSAVGQQAILEVSGDRGGAA